MFKHKLLCMVLLVIMMVSQAVPFARAAQCDSAQFVSDVSIPDGTVLGSGAAFTKTWRFANNGTCTWTTSYKITFVGGDAMGTTSSVKLPISVAPGKTLDISINLTAPALSGHYKSLWKFTNGSGTQFGIGSTGSDAFWVEINVVDISAVVYDFAANAPYAQWKSGIGVLPYPGTSGDSRGYSYQVNSLHLEDDTFDTSPGLLTVPQDKYNGYIQATYPEIQIQKGDKLQTLVSCEFGAQGCYITFRVDYLSAAGSQKTLWLLNETYDKKFHRANVDLSSLAGQKVRFVFMTLASGPTTGDRALWGAPRLVRTGTTLPPALPPTLTPLPALTPTPTPFNQPVPTIGPAGCDKAAFVADVTVPDGTLFSPGAAFTKTWRLKNSGRCNWTTAYKFLFYSGEQMGAPTSINIPRTILPGQTVDLTVNMVAPATTGKFRGNWILSNATGVLFGIGAGASLPIWVEINVAGAAPIGTGYDFAANACAAEWKSGIGTLPCPGTDGSANGFILNLDAPKLEDGTTGAPGLLTFPQNKYNGFIQGIYPTMTVQPGDRFQAIVGCDFGANCYVTYRLDYMTATGLVKTFWSWREKQDGRTYTASVNLGSLAGQTVRFILTISATGYATGDRAVWSAPRIVRVSAPPTPTPAPTPTPVTNSWPTYTNATYAFQLKYPPQSQISNEQSNFVRLDLPFVQTGTNLREKYLEVVVAENANPCQSPLSTPFPPETVTINGISFIKQTAADAGMGHLHQWVAYSTLKNNVCVTLNFILHSLHAENYATPPPVFDFVAESAVFQQMVSTFAWQTSPPVTALANVQSVAIEIVESEALRANAIVRGQLPDAGCTTISSVNQVRDGNTFRLTLTTSADPQSVCAPTPTPFEQVISLDVYELPIAKYTVNANGVEQTFELLSHDFTKFGQTLAVALNSRNYDTMKVFMDQSFVFAFWQSQGYATSPEIAIETMRLNYLGPSSQIVPDTNKDLAALLDGLNPYAIMGLDPAKSQGLFISGWGLDGKSEAILYMTRLPDGSLYWYGVLIAPSGFSGP